MATAFSVSLCACIPKFLPGIAFVTLETISPTSCGSVPPFVSQRTIHLAPSSKAVLIQDNAYSGFSTFSGSEVYSVYSPYNSSSVFSTYSASAAFGTLPSCLFVWLDKGEFLGDVYKF